MKKDGVYRSPPLRGFSVAFVSVGLSTSLSSITLRSVLRLVSFGVLKILSDIVESNKELSLFTLVLPPASFTIVKLVLPPSPSRTNIANLELIGGVLCVKKPSRTKSSSKLPSTVAYPSKSVIFLKLSSDLVYMTTRDHEA